jgi:hypothetical protein
MATTTAQTFVNESELSNWTHPRVQTGDGQVLGLNDPADVVVIQELKPVNGGVKA